MFKVLEIWSGGQTGVDRAALDWAIENKICHTGWCPKGRKAEDGIISEPYSLKETPSDDYAQRTEWNVRDSDGTVIFSISENLVGGSKETLEFAKKYGKPVLHLSRERDSGNTAEKLLVDFLQKHSIERLNVAGPRASEEPEAGEFARQVLERVCKPLD